MAMEAITSVALAQQGAESDEGLAAHLASSTAQSRGG